MANNREPSMEDILASIKRVIAEEKEIRAGSGVSVPPIPADADDLVQLPDPHGQDDGEDILELDDEVQLAPEIASAIEAEPEPAPAPPIDLGPPLVAEARANESRAALESLAAAAAAAPPPPTVNPLEEVVRDMLRPILKEWLDDNLPKMVDEHVKREISRITGRQL